MFKKLAITGLLIAGLVPAAQANRVVLEDTGWDVVYLDTITALTGNQMLSLAIDTNSTKHGALEFYTKDGATGLINCNLEGSTFESNGFTCHYTNDILTGLSAINVFKIKASGTSEKVSVSFGIKRL